MVKIVHITDLHISEKLLEAPDATLKSPHRYGHSVSALLALDECLNNMEWDILVITGDISRIGNIDSFFLARNWIENEINTGDTHIGLNLSKSEHKNYVIIPGNHDSFSGEVTQTGLTNYYKEFAPVVRSGTVESFKIGKETINFHLFDSTLINGDFGSGEINQADLIPRNMADDEINFALLHHHFIQPPNHKRDSYSELFNSDDVAAFMLSTGFDGVLFGHTHCSYIDMPSAEILTGYLKDKRKRRRFWVRRFKKWLISKPLLKNMNLPVNLNKADSCLVSYRREKAKNGQFPTLKTYFDYLYLKKKGVSVKGPAEFENVKNFYESMKEFQCDEDLAKELEAVRKKRILISLSPSACQDEAKWKGFHYIEVKRSHDKSLSYEWDRYEYNNSRFVKLDRDKHQS